jgi:uncharacterized membrane protein YhaH (DUF805 family)
MALFDGRMRRRNFGLFMIGYFVLSLGLGAMSSIGMMGDIQKGKMPDIAAMNQPRWLFYILPCLFIAAFTIAMVRRSNDLNWSPIWAYLFGALSLVSTLYSNYYFDDVMREAMQGKMTTTQIVTSLLGVVLLVFALVLVFKRGTVGPNPHGADPSV